MHEAFELLDPHGAQTFLARLSEHAKKQGDSLFRRGAVQDFEVDEPGVEYVCKVKDGELCEVGLWYDSGEGWCGECTCNAGFDCEHVFAGMSALLAENRMAVVRSLSGGFEGAAAALAASRPKPGPPETGELPRRVMAERGGPLTREEASFLGRIHRVYEQCCQSRRITPWDFQQMGLPIREPAWGSMQIWPTFPETEYEFWLYVANTLVERGLEIPELLQPITDLGQIDDRLARWRRALEVQKWTQNLEHFSNITAPAPAGEAPAGPTDLRVAFSRKEARLEWLRPGQKGFESLKLAQYRQLSLSFEEGEVQFTPEGELIWQLFKSDYVQSMRIGLEHLDDPVSRVLSRLLRSPLLEGRLVNAAGQPLRRSTAALRWELTPAASDDEDYRLRLVLPDGSAMPEVLCVLPGRPTLYLTETTIYPGPVCDDSLLDAGAETRIPAAAIEQANGLAFLQSLGLELPPRIRERVRFLMYEVVITCALRPAHPGAQTEECVVTVLAEAPDGRLQTWTNRGWSENLSGRPRKPPKGNRQITLYDSSRMDQVPALLAPLNLKPAFYGGDPLVTKVTKKFPAIFAAWLKSVPPHITVQLKGELASFTNVDVAGHVKLDVTEAEIDWFDLRVVLDVADATLTAEEIRMLLSAKGGYVRLKGKGWRRLQYDLSEEENERLARLGLNPRELTDEPQRLHALQLADESAKKFLPEQQVEQIQRRASEIKARVVPDLPAGVTAQLRPYQLEGFHFLAYLSANRFGGILADDMGLGKTLQTLAWLLWLRQPVAAPGQQSFAAENGATPELPLSSPAPAASASLVICPKSVMDNWRAEAEHFTPSLRVRVWPAGELGGFDRELESADLHVINYTQLRFLGDDLAAVRWLAVILDEGQYIKNPNSQTAQMARALKAQHRLILTGTPIENRLLDLWSLMAFAMPGVLSSRAQFARLYDAKDDPFARRRLAARVRPFVLRRTKGQVARDLPDRVEEDLFCEIEGEQKTLYRAELKRAQQLLLGIKTQKELAQQQFHFLTSLLRLRQICCHPRLVKPDSKAESAKTESLLDQLEPLMEEGQKVLVFSQFVEMLDLLRPILEERQWPVFYLAGHTENRGELVRQFQSAEGAAVFLISLKAGGFGLNLTAASYVVLFDPWWNPAVENQAIDRTHRIGQTNKVIAYRLLIKNSIEEKIRELQKQKKALAEDVLGEEKFAQSLTLDDLRFLFAD